MENAQGPKEKKRRSERSPRQAKVSPSSEMRLQKFLSQCGVASRRHAEQLIREGVVEVNDRIVRDLGVKVNPDKDLVRVRRRIVKPPHKGVILLNKPRGVVSTMSDPEGRPTVADFLTREHRAYFPVGRLDWESTGLMVLTNDGEIAERLMHPRYGFERIYHVRVEGVLTERQLERMGEGVRLEDGLIRARSKLLKRDQDTCWLELSVSEGRNRVVRRLMDKLRHPVMKLKRVAYGPFRLGNLQTGEIRKLTQSEYEASRRRILSQKERAKER
ncbi:MAG: rRNA pseudouridine synthase [Oligoflexia bacterium]|nr:rRNA pseudouridine synthase [Oligoflexia bacterium]